LYKKYKYLVKLLITSQKYKYLRVQIRSQRKVQILTLSRLAHTHTHPQHTHTQTAPLAGTPSAADQKEWSNAFSFVRKTDNPVVGKAGVRVVTGAAPYDGQASRMEGQEAGGDGGVVAASAVAGSESSVLVPGSQLDDKYLKDMWAGSG
jgi:hypothetical protein